MIEQGSDEWHAQRCGKVTASRISDVIAKTKTGWGASRSNYMAELVAERLTGAPVEGFTNAAMRWGKETEPEARAAYEFYSGHEVALSEFVPHPSIDMSGASPDGLIGDHGLVEIKCPVTATHIETLLGGSVPDKYVVQMLWQMECTGRQWCDFVSYDPRMPEDMALFVQRVERDQKRIEQLRELVCDFLRETNEKVEALVAKYRRRAA